MRGHVRSGEKFKEKFCHRLVVGFLCIMMRGNGGELRKVFFVF